MNVSEANALFGIYRALLGEQTPEQAREHAEFLAKRSSAVLHAGPAAGIVGATIQAAIEVTKTAPA